MLNLSLLCRKKIPLVFLFFSGLCSHASAQNPIDSLLLHLPMDGNANDISGNFNDGTIVNAVPDTDRFGDPQGAFRLNGVDSYIEIPASVSLNKFQTAQTIYISAWVNINQWHISGNVFSIFERYNAATDAGWLFEANWAGGGILFLADETNNTNYAGCNFSWTFDQWYHVCLTYSQENAVANFYINGEQVCSTPYTLPINVTDTLAPFVIGRSLAGPDEYSDGKIDDYKLYYRELTDNEVEQIFITGISAEPNKNNFSVFPNPAEKSITLLRKKDARSEYTFTGLHGDVILKGKINSKKELIDISMIPPGIYFLAVDGRVEKVVVF